MDAHQQEIWVSGKPGMAMSLVALFKAAQDTNEAFHVSTLSCRVWTSHNIQILGEPDPFKQHIPVFACETDGEEFFAVWRQDAMRLLGLKPPALNELVNGGALRVYHDPSTNPPIWLVYWFDVIHLQHLEATEKGEAVPEWLEKQMVEFESVMKHGMTNIFAETYGKLVWQHLQNAEKGFEAIKKVPWGKTVGWKNHPKAKTIVHPGVIPFAATAATLPPILWEKKKVPSLQNVEIASLQVEESFSMKDLDDAIALVNQQGGMPASVILPDKQGETISLQQMKDMYLGKLDAELKAWKAQDKQILEKPDEKG